MTGPIEASGIGIIGLGHHLPTRIETNEELCANLDVTPEWIIEKTGIARRYLALPEDTASGYALAASRKALDSAGLSAADIDLVVACTFSADYTFPPLSAKVHKDLGLRGGQIFDLQANCSGFVSGLTAATDRMRLDDSVRNALVIGVEMNSRVIDRRNADASIYHSDGAGAVVLGRTPGAGIIASSFHTDSSNYEAVRLRGGGSSFRAAGSDLDPTVAMMELNGIATWKQAITHLPPVIRSALAKAGATVPDVDFFIFHQANLRLIEYLVRKMKIEDSRTFTNVQDIGNTGAASVPIALSEAWGKGLLAKGSLVTLAAVGAGFNFGASAWRWAIHPPTPGSNDVSGL
jgi:3-oxoacyl-[acyl-carrier-protein] synthase-3